MCDREVSGGTMSEIAMPADANPERPLKETIIEPTQGWGVGFVQVWQYRELLRVLLWRALAVRYRQMALGVLWMVLEPLAQIGIMFVVFGLVLRLPSEGFPYPLFVFSGLVPFLLFRKAVDSSADCLRENMGLISKVYFPRLLLPISAVVRDAVDVAVNLLVLILLSVAYGYIPGPAVFLLPFVMLIPALTAMGIGLWTASLVVRLRDLRHIIGIGVQIVMYGSPIIYSPEQVPAVLRPYYELNPLYWSIEFFRWALLGRDLHITPQFYVSLVLVVSLFISGLFIFNRFERLSVDVQ